MIPVRIAGFWGCAPLLLSGLLACGGATPAPAAPSEDEAPEAGHAAKRAKDVELLPSDIVMRLRGNETDLRRCFFANPSLHGAARFSWQLDVEGKVHAVRREASSLGDARVEACLEQRLSEIDFGDFAEPASARWTFVFRLVDPPSNSKRASRAAKHKAAEDERGLVIEPSSPGTLTSDAIDNVVEAGYPLFARCYRDGVNRNDRLGGTLRLRFAISPAGTVSEVTDGGSDLSDRQVVDCVAEGFYALQFPQPEHGQVNVLYKIRFEAG
ncbi:MAG: AgmX/PglI C-terminal domain-containing protein [Polyangiaceae bacterium]